MSQIFNQGDFKWPKSSQLVNLSPEELRDIRGFGAPKTFNVTYPKKVSTAAEANAALKKWIDSVPVPKAEQPAPKAIKAVKFTAEHVTMLRAVNESTAPTAEMVNQKLEPEDLLGITYSAFVAYHYWRLAGDRKKMLAAAKDKAGAADDWDQVVDGAKSAFAVAGVRGLKEDDLDKMAAELNRNESNFNMIATLANSAEASPASPSKKLGYGNFVTQTLKIPGPLVVVAAPVNICSQPLAQGSYTKHFGHTFNMQVTFNAPCVPKFWKTCTYTINIASLSYAVDLNVGYKITCCGASAWGQAGAQVCASVLGKTFCASCTASVTAVAGISKTQTGSKCNYGLGVVAELKCSLGSVTLLDVHVPYGWTVTGPCPPLGIC